jgi:formylglycine-generating enzyme required for sulfatase activity
MLTATFLALMPLLAQAGTRPAATAGCSRKENAAPASPATAKVLSASDQPTIAPQSPSLGVERREPWENSLGIKFAPGAKFTAKVGSSTANRFGIHDLGGNVWEWSSDWYNADRKERAARGASFNQSTIDFLLSSLRTRNAPGTREFNLGFRVVLTASASSHDERVR